MRDLGWTAVRVRYLTRGGYLEQVRGYCRDGWDRINVQDQESVDRDDDQKSLSLSLTKP
jgi:hypothetical protein